jgi:hypothetical protein
VLAETNGTMLFKLDGKCLARRYISPKPFTGAAGPAHVDKARKIAR